MTKNINMKMRLALLLALLSSGVAVGQTLPVGDKGKVAYTTTLQVPLSKKELAANAMQWVAKVAGNPGRCVQQHDTATGKMQLASAEKACSINGTSARVTFSAAIAYAEGQCSLTIYDIKSRTFGNCFPVSYTLDVSKNQALKEARAKLKAAKSAKEKKEYQQQLATLTREINDFNALFNRYLDRFKEIMAKKSNAPTPAAPQPVS
ncbi:hypothetical protein [uncultured Acetobacteroides sp.]|uniref:hypothetical protein n=1 Tax=uncultured Acetobacteroides sp. TaxID=1760811 RepID=UPI0029F57F1F|nr:hypothetical protein [uncultured Acetobacteroides sp.]